MEKKSLKRKLVHKERSAKPDQLGMLKEGYLSLIVLSDKYGYAKDYIGWLSRTGRIEAVRYGKYGQWYASEDSLKTYISSLASASEQRYSAQSKAVSRDRQNVSSLPSVVVAELAVVGPLISTEKVISSEPIGEKNLPIELPFFKKEEQNMEPAEFPAPHVYTAESETRPEVPFSVPSLPRRSFNEGGSNKSSLSAEKNKKLAKRINAVLRASLLTGGVLILLVFFPRFPVFSEALNYLGNAIRSPIAYLWNRLFAPSPEGVYVTIVEGEKGERGETGQPGQTGISPEAFTKITKEVQITRDLTPSQLSAIYQQISQANTRIDDIGLRLSSLSSVVSQLSPTTTAYISSPVFQLPSTNTQGVPITILNPSEIETKKLTVTERATLQTLSVLTNANITGHASASQYFGGGLADCDGATTNKLLWDETTGKFSCGTDQSGGGGGSALQVKEGLTSILNPVATISFDAGGFAVTPSGSAEVVVRIDYTNGPASRAADQTITGFWEFRSGASFSNDVEFYNTAGTRFVTIS
ncbi:MAG: hypothetical protein Q8R55_03535, partial [Candidatus Taylorbacteria bacterium]|nr:hypothetical protein [Candidatus Taylorbacteria bacterium]